MVDLFANALRSVRTFWHRMVGRVCFRFRRIEAARRHFEQVLLLKGDDFVAYFYLARRPGQSVARTERVEPGLVVDFDEQDKPLGIEITAPSQLTLETFNRLLKRLGQDPVQEADFSPLKAA